jgi:hypothetical protein
LEKCGNSIFIDWCLNCSLHGWCLVEGGGNRVFDRVG